MSLIRKLGWFFKLEARRYMIGILALSLVSVFNLIPPRIIGQVIDAIAGGNLTPSELALNLTWLVGASLIMYALRYVWRLFILGTANSLGRILRTRLFDHFTRMAPSFYTRYRTGDLMAHATSDVQTLVMTAGGGVAILPLPVLAWGTSRLGRINHEGFKQAQEAFSELNNSVQESVSGIKVTKSFGYGAQEMAKFQATNQMVWAKNLRAAKYNELFQPMVLIFVGASYLISLLYGGYLISQGQFTVGEMVTFMTYLDMLVWPLQAIGWLFNIMQRGSVSLDRIDKLLHEESPVRETEHPLPSIQNGRLDYDIESFAYQDLTTLEDVHFSLEAGQTLGIVGTTGSGKTSLLRLLLREQDVNVGSIRLDGHDIRDYRLSDLRSLMGYVPQDQLLFAMSIRDNVRFGQTDLDDAAIIRATQLCGVYQDIQAMPEGLDTLIGERGVSLSGGQKQRLAMSRALILDPDILILDDSLSAVDAKTEHLILENLKSERQGKTTIITAHRLSAVVHADLILVMEDGRIKERGNHQELLAQNGWYATTYRSQQLAQSLEGGDLDA